MLMPVLKLNLYKMRCTHNHIPLVVIVFLASLSLCVAPISALIAPPNKAEVLISNDVTRFLQTGECKHLQGSPVLGLLLQPLEISITTEGLVHNKTSACTRIYPQYEHRSMPDPVGEACVLAFSTLKEACAVGIGSAGKGLIHPAEAVKPRMAVTLGDVCATLSDWVNGLRSENDQSMKLYGNHCEEICTDQDGVQSKAANKDCYGLYLGRKLLQALKQLNPGTSGRYVGTFIWWSLYILIGCNYLKPIRAIHRICCTYIGNFYLPLPMLCFIT